MAAHKNAEWIIAVANGEEVEFLDDGEWLKLKDLSLLGMDVAFRIKPEPVYPESSLTAQELIDYWDDFTESGTIAGPILLQIIANAAVKRHCQDQEKEGK